MTISAESIDLRNRLLATIMSVGGEMSLDGLKKVAPGRANGIYISTAIRHGYFEWGRDAKGNASSIKITNLGRAALASQ